MANCGVKTNRNVGAASEEWYGLKGEQLIEVMRNKRVEIPEMVERAFK
jgi:hypothetical protein